MAKRDTKRTSHYSLKIQEQSLDIPPHKSTKKAKAKERQEGRKEIKEATFFLFAVNTSFIDKKVFVKFTMDYSSYPPQFWQYSPQHS